MCWVAEGTLDVGNHWDYKRESERGTNSREAFVRMSGFCVTIWDVISLAAGLSENSCERVEEENMAQQSGAINRGNAVAWALSNGERLIGKASVWLRVQGVHGNMKGERWGLRFWQKRVPEHSSIIGTDALWRQKTTRWSRVQHTQDVIIGRAGSGVSRTWAPNLALSLGQFLTLLEPQSFHF